MIRDSEATGPAPSRRFPIYKDLLLLQLAALVFLTDQFTKFLVREFLAFRESYPVEGFLRITHTFNTGSAFGLFRDQNVPLILVSVVGITVLALIYRSQRRHTDLLRLSLGLQVGGATGNLLDRLRLGHVTDFMDVGSWPVFNVADASIVTGLALLAWILIKSDRERELEGKAARQAALLEVYDWCPVCDGEMVPLPVGWRCSTCGVRERVDAAGVAAADPPPAPRFDPLPSAPSFGTGDAEDGPVAAP
ncbi:MAG: signal peptidase II [Dehalococcoidia bacterium]|jgi:signal peptidase II|nr:signal peptidase II [Dehalococcoidia bacterium]MDP6227295.1 signal peptidase II [Dehalococcoidia bacterium]MDP7083556.1 signal peptidase II [Dehalococcoidia bacterium]MDP7199350.1 signal peptidase II [Dehalococcoidia bacterium]MDP7510054.1 signal peptidase II [Dehalococcoidia bacterium]